MRVTKIFSSLTGILTVGILTIGLAAGVVLVKSNQDYRNKAAELKEHKVSICHKTGSDSNTWVQLEVSDNAKESHLSHGDIEGNCPSSDKDKDKDKDKDHGNGNDNRGGGGGGGGNQGGVTINNVTVNNQTVAAAQVETKYIFVTTQFDFWISFQGIEVKKPDKIVRVVFQGTDDLHVYNKVVVVSDLHGVYHGVIRDVKPGLYDVSIKGDGYLQKKFTGVTISKGKNNNNWGKTVLLAGDFNGDNVLDSKDIAEFLSFYTEDLNPVTGENKVFDIDLNGQIDLSDLKFVLTNFKSLKVDGDN